MAKLVAAILILIHVHHSLVMIAGDIMQVKVVSTAIKAGIPLFEHNGSSGADGGSAETLEMDDADFCARNYLIIDPALQPPPRPLHFNGLSHPGVHPVHVEILTPPPQA